MIRLRGSDQEFMPLLSRQTEWAWSVESRALVKSSSWPRGCFVFVIFLALSLTSSAMEVSGEEVSREEALLLRKLVNSFPSVFARQGTPDDVNFILSYLKQAVCLRGISTSSQQLVVELLAPLSSFKAGFMDMRQLREAVDRVSASYPQPICRKVRDIVRCSVLADSVGWKLIAFSSMPFWLGGVIRVKISRPRDEDD